MKNSIKLLLTFVSIVLFSCTNDVQDIDAVTADSSFKLISPTSNFNLILDGAKLTNLATNIVWDNPSSSGAITYTVEAAKAGTNFATTTTLGTSTKSNLEVTVGQLDAAAKTLGLKALVEGQLDVRVKSSGGAVSNYASIKVTPYQPIWSMIGDAAVDWNTDSVMAYNSNNDTYSLSLNLKVGEFKFRLDKAWGTNYGDDGNNLSLDSGGTNIKITTAGNYTIVANFTTKTYTITQIPTPSANWGIVGSATAGSWNTDTLLDYNATTQKYSIIVKLKAGELKFRLNNDWGNNYGDDGNNLSMEPGGANIAIKADGTYYITADFVAKTYTITKI